MTNTLKEFIENNIKLIDDNNWGRLFIEAYDECLMTSEVIELHNMLFQAGIVDSTQIRNDLLYDYISENINFVRDKYLKYAANPDEMRVVDVYAAQFLRNYLNNTFGFPEREVLEFMRDNERAFGITLEPTDKSNGQHAIANYKIHYDGLS